MKPVFPTGPATRSALYALGLMSTLKALSLVLMAQAVAGDAGRTNVRGQGTPARRTGTTG